jgi:hypothetical protein
MPFIGNKPSAVPLTSADITDNIIVNADINSSAAIALTKLASTGTLTVDNIQFPATAVASANANTLDDYEEGSFTPTITGSTTPGTATYSSQVGKYTKIGNAVTIQVNVTWSSGNGSGTAMYIVGLPFTSQSGFIQALTTGYVNNIAMTAGEYCNVNIGGNTSFVRLFTDLVGGGATDDLPYDAAGEISVGGTYFV